MAAPARRSRTIEIRAPLRRADLPGLFERTCELLASGAPEQLRCDVTAVDADGVVLDALARLTLAARRAHCSVLLCGASPRLCELIAFAGLDDVLHS
ncbi:MAG TPA: STAS domain-containing protein [Burkholderiaceae bacterium]